eukprot:1142957-Pelagomonas_calceolata.AAC.8
MLCVGNGGPDKGRLGVPAGGAGWDCWAALNEEKGRLGGAYDGCVAECAGGFGCVALEEERGRPGVTLSDSGGDSAAGGGDADDGA